MNDRYITYITTNYKHHTQSRGSLIGFFGIRDFCYLGLGIRDSEEKSGRDSELEVCAWGAMPKPTLGITGLKNPTSWLSMSFYFLSPVGGEWKTVLQLQRAFSCSGPPHSSQRYQMASCRDPMDVQFTYHYR